ncbi:efflux RND transporter periplasmic adaptor subunit [Marinomonas sp.]|uniref:efflux RND transporter periplasmic adaptor subunit n=1 Tax=Marinomonas sp. TaxID=1904862 RepID=UPI003A92DB06
MTSTSDSKNTSEPEADGSTVTSKIFGLTHKHIGIVLLVIAILVLAITAGVRFMLGPRVLLEIVVQRDFVQTVVASGRVEAPHRVDIGVQITGTVRAVPVNEGQRVEVNMPLVELESSELHAAVSQAKAAVLLAKAELRQLHEVEAPMAEQEVEEAKANQMAALQDLERSQSLLKKHLISQSSLDEAVRAEKVTRSKVSSLQSKMISLQTNGSQVALDEASLEQAQAGLELAQAKLAYTTLKAPVDGVLIARNVEPGDVVQPGETLMQLSPSGETQMVVQIEEKNLHLLALNQSALASADAYPDQLFSAQLVYINPGIDSDRGSVEVKLQVPEPPDYLRQDMTVSVDIKVASRSDAVLVSSAAVHDVNSVVPWVLKLDGKQVHRQVVTLGLRSDGMSEVLTGLSAGDQVVPVSSVTVTDGDRIRPLQQADSL